MTSGPNNLIKELWPALLLNPYTTFTRCRILIPPHFDLLIYKV
jgi:hypothetical protein